MKPTLFIGSSTEAIEIAESVQRITKHVADATIWNQGVFDLNVTVYDALVRKAKYFDYSIFIFSADDILSIREESVSAVRDNVLFELGFFSAILGSKRCFFLMPKNTCKFRIPSELRGLIYEVYDIQRNTRNIDGIIGAACGGIISAIRNPDILSGDWSLKIEGSITDEPNGTFNIIHTGSRVTARLELEKSKSGTSTHRVFSYEGRYLSGQIVLQFEQSGAEDYIVGNLTLRVDSSMRGMRGVAVFWHHDQAKMVVENFLLLRQ